MDWHKVTEKPESGKRVVALYNDGSGAALFLVHDHGVIDSDGDDYKDISPENFDVWTHLPDDFELHFEGYEEHPTPY